MNESTKPEPLTEAQIAEFHDRGIGGGGLSAFWANKLLATLDATRAQLAIAEEDRTALRNAACKADGILLGHIEGLKAQLTAATERAERAEAERGVIREALRERRVERDDALRELRRMRESLQEACDRGLLDIEVVRDCAVLASSSEPRKGGENG